ncbi:MAG: hypothetical protein OCD02_11475 [Spirochaetaceae bacterium]
MIVKIYTKVLIRLIIYTSTLYVAGDHILTTLNLDYSNADTLVVAYSDYTPDMKLLYVSGSTVVAAIDTYYSRSTDSGETFVDDYYTLGGGSIMGFANDGTYLVCVKYGGKL